MTLLKSDTVDFQKLVNNHSTNLSLNFQCKMVDKLKQHFNDNEQGWFIANVYVFLNYHPTNEFLINLQDVFDMIDLKGNVKKNIGK
jgi:hypothetical protein